MGHKFAWDFLKRAEALNFLLGSSYDFFRYAHGKMLAYALGNSEVMIHKMATTEKSRKADKDKDKEKQKKVLISYYAKQATECPVCGTHFQQELLHSGRGRLVSVNITPELRRLYKPNKKYGKIYPQTYSILTCPDCLYSAFPNDFADVVEEEVLLIKKLKDSRRQKIEKLLGPLSFHERRNLVLGAASYLLALDCYARKESRVAPTPKKAVCCLRSAWLFGDLAEDFPKRNFGKLRDFLYVQAARYYSPSLNILSTETEPRIQFLSILGPDTDKNWNFEGVVYINSYLSYKYASKLAPDNQEAQIKLQQIARRNLGQLYGHGKASFAKPSLIVEYARTLYDKITEELEKRGVGAA